MTRLGSLHVASVVALLIPSFTMAQQHQLERLRYHRADLIVDVGVGLWGQPIVMDYDEDGLVDLLLAWGGRPEPGVLRYERVESDPASILVKPMERASNFRRGLVTSFSNERWRVLSPQRVYPDYRRTGIEHDQRLPFKPAFHNDARFTQWRLYDFDNDGDDDLLIAAHDSRPYQGDEQYDAHGQWLNGIDFTHYYWVRNTGNDANPAYDEPPIQIMAGDQPMRTLTQPAPNFADFDGDGLPDLISSDWIDTMSFFKNVGEPGNPRFAPGKKLANERGVVTMDLEMIAPTAADWDGDGRVDLIVAEEDGRVSLMRNTGEVANGVPVFESPQFFQQPADEVKFGVLATPYCYDLDGDGDEDIIAGNTAGYFGFIENLGGDPVRWAAPVYLETDGEVIRVLAGDNGSIQGPAEGKWGYTVLSVADWDGDGLPDLVTNSIWGKVTWYRNAGERTKPKFAAAQPIEVQWDGPAPKPAWTWWEPAGNELATQWRSSVHAIDLTGDGLCDLVALDTEGYLALYERVKQPDGSLALLPPKRVFHVEPGAPSVFDHNQNVLDIDGLRAIDATGNMSYHGFVTKDGKRTQDIVRTAPAQNKDVEPTMLRLTSGWAGRSGRRKFVLADFDHDGRIDLLVNSINVNFLRNVSDEPGKFVFRDMGPVDSLVLAGHTTCPAVTDLDGDGKPDLVIGTEDGFFYVLKNPY